MKTTRLATGNNEEIYAAIKPYLSKADIVQEITVHWWIELESTECCEIHVVNLESPGSELESYDVALTTEQGIELFRKLDEVVEMPQTAQDMKLHIKAIEVVELEYKGYIALRSKRPEGEA